MALNKKRISFLHAYFILKVVFCNITLYVLRLGRENHFVFSVRDDGDDGAVSADSLPARRFYRHAELTFINPVHQLNQTVSAAALPDVMYDRRLLQHNEAILNQIHNATKMPCQYLLPRQYNKVLPVLY